MHGSYPDSDDTAEPEPLPSHRGYAIVDVQTTTLAGTGHLSAQQSREPHLTTTLELVA